MLVSQGPDQPFYRCRYKCNTTERSKPQYQNIADQLPELADALFKDPRPIGLRVIGGVRKRHTVEEKRQAQIAVGQGRGKA